MRDFRFAILLGALSVAAVAACNSSSNENRLSRDKKPPKQESETHDKTAEPADPLDDLGRQFLTAIQEDDFDKYHACWLRLSDFEAMIKNPPPDMPAPSKEQLDQMREYVANRDDFLRLTFPILRRALNDKCGGVDELALSDVIANNVSVENGQRGASSIDVVLSVKDKVFVNYHIDDGAFANDRWYFSDKPDLMLTITSGKDKSENVLLGSFATEEETAKLRAFDGP
jgi:hypothetical protein